jgi:hypothetical protein
LTDPRYVTEIDVIVYDVINDVIASRTDKRNNHIEGIQNINNFIWGSNICNNNKITGSYGIAQNLKNIYGNFDNNIIHNCLLTFEVPGNFNYVVSSNIFSNAWIIFSSGYPQIYRCNVSLSILQIDTFPIYINITASTYGAGVLSFLINDTSSSLEVDVSTSVSGSVLTIPNYAAYAGVLYLPTCSIDTIIPATGSGPYVNNRFEIDLMAKAEATVTINPTASTSATSVGKIMSDSLTPITISSPVPFMAPPYYANKWGFYRIRSAYYQANVTASWHTVMYKQYL